MDVGSEVKSMVVSRCGTFRSNPSSDASPLLWMGMIIGIWVDGFWRMERWKRDDGVGVGNRYGCWLRPLERGIDVSDGNGQLVNVERVLVRWSLGYH